MRPGTWRRRERGLGRERVPWMVVAAGGRLIAGGRVVWMVAAAGLVASGGAVANEPDEAPTAPVAEDLDPGSLLRLPDSYSLSSERRGGATPAEWRARFAKADAEVQAALDAIEKTEREIGQTAGESAQWQMSAPGVGNPDSQNSPVSYKLRQQVRAQRAELDRAQRRRRELDVEADLAAVPPDWRE